MHSEPLRQGNLNLKMSIGLRNSTMIKLYTLLLIEIVSLLGCASLQSVGTGRNLFAMQIQKKQVDVIKNEILNKGYERRGKEDYRYSGAITNLYEKVITNTTFKINRKIQILLTFKETDMQPDIYRNVYITIGVFDAADIPEVNEEVVRIEEALYKKLIEVAGDNNVVRGKPDSNSPQPAGFHAPTPLMPPRPTK